MKLMKNHMVTMREFAGITLAELDSMGVPSIIQGECFGFASLSEHGCPATGHSDEKRLLQFEDVLRFPS